MKLREFTRNPSIHKVKAQPVESKKKEGVEGEILRVNVEVRNKRCAVNTQSLHEVIDGNADINTSRKCQGLNRGSASGGTRRNLVLKDDRREHRYCKGSKVI